MSYVRYDGTVYFTVEQYNVIDVDRMQEGYCRLNVTTRNQNGGYFYYHMTFYDANGNVIKEGTYSGSQVAGATETEDTYIPRNTVRIVINSAN